MWPRALQSAHLSPKSDNLPNLPNFGNARNLGAYGPPTHPLSSQTSLAIVEKLKNRNTFSVSSNGFCCYRLRCVTSWPAAAEPQSSKTFSSPVAFSRCVNEMISSLSMFVLPSKYHCMVAIIVGDSLCCCIEKGLVILLHTVESIWGSESLEIGNPCICKNI